MSADKEARREGQRLLHTRRQEGRKARKQGHTRGEGATLDSHLEAKMATKMGSRLLGATAASLACTHRLPVPLTSGQVACFLALRLTVHFIDGDPYARATT